MNPTPTVGRPPGQRGRKSGRRQIKVTGSWSQKASELVAQSIQTEKGLEPIKIPKKRGPKPGSKVGMKRLQDRPCFCISPAMFCRHTLTCHSMLLPHGGGVDLLSCGNAICS